MKDITIKFPTWIESLPKKEQPRNRMKFVLRIAACLATPEGTITSLSKRIGLHQNTLSAMLTAGSLDDGLPVNILKAIETAIGVGAIPREILNPSVYGQA